MTLIMTAALSIALSSAAVGTPRTCVKCHAAQAGPQPSTSMAHALELASECRILSTHPLLTFSAGKYKYRIVRSGNESIYSVTDGRETITAPIRWAFGLGAAGQTYVFEKDGALYQSRVSYYRDIDGLDKTIGAGNADPATLREAAGQMMDRGESVACFGCHATDAVVHNQLTLQSMMPGVQCERCHGPTENHLEGIRRGDAKLAAMRDLKALSTEDVSNFCGQCHRTWEQIAAGGKLGISDIRFQPYRLTNSKCYDTEDRRISCVACHDPHREVDRVDSHYDAKCQACHAGGKPEARACKVSDRNCVTCHMPKLDLPGSHFKFTDHQIRIVRANEAYPN